jgi:hypothetical protein
MFFANHNSTANSGSSVPPPPQGELAAAVRAVSAAAGDAAELRTQAALLVTRLTGGGGDVRARIAIEIRKTPELVAHAVQRMLRPVFALGDAALAAMVSQCAEQQVLV